MRKVIGTLLAVSALLPTAAQAQRNIGREDGPPRGERFHAPREVSDASPAPAPAERRAQGDWQGRGDRGDSPQAQPGSPDNRAEGGWRGREGQTGYAGARGDAQARFERGRDLQHRQDAGRPDVPRTDLYRDRAPDRGPAFGGSRFDGRSQIDTRSRIDTRSHFDNRTNYDNRRYAERPYDNRGYQDRSGFDRNYAAGRWNRDWRRDDRYDWNHYRSNNSYAFRLPRYYAPYGWDYGYRRFSIGLTLSSVLWGEDYWIDDPFAYRLPEAYGPYRWVRYYNDALLVDLRSGVVVDAVYDIFY